MFITFEGTEGAGKTLQSRMLLEYLSEKGLNTLLVREPGGVVISEKIREIILDVDHEAMSPVTEALLYAAARAQLVSEVIKPALLEGKTVICDRFVDSSIVYQGIARGLGIEEVEGINHPALMGVFPHVTFLLDLDPAEGFKRKKGHSLDRLERECMEFHRTIFQGYRILQKRQPQRIRIIDAARAPQEVWEQIKKEMDVIMNKS